ncbi:MULTISPECIES: hypothetical protein [Saliphagus]|uniref:Drought induced 19 protein type zinc-binding domain-containing protein n=1 Tax=Saliphagus infecundisoli TaxID=1849069 RepID=A0ABD5QA39_9EURY|nr:MULTISPECIES: hypothetical protein [Saliphagus]
MAQRTVEAADRTVAEETNARTTTPGERRTCPLCAFAADGDGGIYDHLQASHRKSALSRLVADEL